MKVATKRRCKHKKRNPSKDFWDIPIPKLLYGMFVLYFFILPFITTPIERQKLIKQGKVTVGTQIQNSRYTKRYEYFVNNKRYTHNGILGLKGTMEAIVYLPEDPSTSWPLKTVMNSYAYKKIHKRQKSDFLSIPTQFKYPPEILCYPRVYEKTKIGSYYLEYAIIPNEDIIKYGHPEMFSYISDNSIIFSVKYDDMDIVRNKEVRKYSLPGRIPYIDNMILSPHGQKLKITEYHDKLELTTTILQPNTEWGYSVTISINAKGNIEYSYKDYKGQNESLKAL